MLQIIQDYKDWKMAHLILKQKSELLQSYKQNMIQNCSESIWNTNQQNKRLFENYKIPQTNSIMDLINIVRLMDSNLKAIDEAAHKYRASSCIYRFGNEIDYCINFSTTENVISNARCNGCPQHMFLKHLQKLNQDFYDKRQDYENARNKLLNDLCFWEHR